MWPRWAIEVRGKVTTSTTRLKQMIQGDVMRDEYMWVIEAMRRTMIDLCLSWTWYTDDGTICALLLDRWGKIAETWFEVKLPTTLRTRQFEMRCLCRWVSWRIWVEFCWECKQWIYQTSKNLIEAGLRPMSERFVNTLIYIIKKGWKITNDLNKQTKRFTIPNFYRSPATN